MLLKKLDKEAAKMIKACKANIIYMQSSIKKGDDLYAQHDIDDMLDQIKCIKLRLIQTKTQLPFFHKDESKGSIYNEKHFLHCKN